MIDLRSDTVTKPTPAMRRAMAEAEVGDDVYAEDPTVNLLQERAAEIFGKEAALFVPTGSMGNQIAVKLHTNPGDEIVIEERGHIFNYEMGTPAVVAGVMIRPVKSQTGSGILIWAEIESALHVNQPYYACPTGLICLENSHNLAGGTVMTAIHCAGICDRAHEIGIPVHLDGARIFNASVALGESVAELSKTAIRCSLLVERFGRAGRFDALGTKDFIEEARVWRKRLGGGMRQVGILAAAGLIALTETPKILHRDNENAKRLAEGAANLKGVAIDPEKVATNIVIFDVTSENISASEICACLKERGILASAFGNSIRMVTHYNVSHEDIEKTLKTLSVVIRP